MKITAQWFGGRSYALPDGKDVEHFASIQDAKDTLWRRSDFDPFYPCVEDSEMLCYFGELEDVTDIYPDFRLYIGPGGGVRREAC